MDLWDDMDYYNDPEAEMIELINQERTYIVRERIEHINHWNDVEFFNRFRFSKGTVRLIHDHLEENLQNRTGR